jgi:hypothetical protein
MEEAEEEGEERHRDRRGMALHEDAIGALTSLACTSWLMNDKYQCMQWSSKRRTRRQPPNWWRVYTR